MIKMLALFRQPEDTDEFDSHYTEVHAPLMRAVPGLERMEIIRDLKSFGAESLYYQITEMYFRDQDSFDAAMRSPENRAAGKDLMSFARDIVSLVYGQVEE